MTIMAQFVASQIDLLERQVDACAAQPSTYNRAALCQDVEELMSIYIAFLQDVDETVTRVSPQTRWNQAEVDKWLPCYKSLARIGPKVRDLIRSLKSMEFEIAGVHAFMESFVAAKAWAEAEENAKLIAAVEAGEIKTRPIEDLLNELSHRNHASSRSGFGSA